MSRVFTLDLEGLTPGELDALIVALEARKNRPGVIHRLSDSAWAFSHALDGEEHHRVRTGQPVYYSEAREGARW